MRQSESATTTTEEFGELLEADGVDGVFVTVSISANAPTAEEASLAVCMTMDRLGMKQGE